MPEALSVAISRRSKTRLDEVSIVVRGQRRNLRHLISPMNAMASHPPVFAASTIQSNVETYKAPKDRSRIHVALTTDVLVSTLFAILANAQTQQAPTAEPAAIERR